MSSKSDPSAEAFAKISNLIREASAERFTTRQEEYEYSGITREAWDRGVSQMINSLGPAGHPEFYKSLGTKTIKSLDPLRMKHRKYVNLKHEEDLTEDDSALWIRQTVDVYRSKSWSSTTQPAASATSVTVTIPVNIRGGSQSLSPRQTVEDSAAVDDENDVDDGSSAGQSPEVDSGDVEPSLLACMRTLSFASSRKSK